RASIPRKENRATVNGYIKDEETGEVLIGAYVFIPGRNSGAITNRYGYYSLTVDEGYYQIVSGLVGYSSQTIQAYISKDYRHDFNLKNSARIKEVKVLGKKNVILPNLHVSQFTSDDIIEYPFPLGQGDV